MTLSFSNCPSAFFIVRAALLAYTTRASTEMLRVLRALLFVFLDRTKGVEITGGVDPVFGFAGSVMAEEDGFGWEGEGL
jgi:hypothetical protein